MSIDLIYKKKIVAFLDIMGFKSIVKESETDLSFQKHVIACLVELKEKEYERPPAFRKLERYHKTVTAFSDSIVITYDAIDGDAVSSILFDIYCMQIDLVASGFLLRGAVTIGDVFHNGGVIVGPAMVKAYELESKVAIYPRVIVDPALINQTLTSWEDDPDIERKQQNLMWILRSCENEYYFIDFLKCAADLGYAYSDFLKDLKVIIDKGLTAKDFGVVSKYEWLKKYYDHTTNNA